MIYQSPPIGSLIFSFMYGINKELIKNNTKLEEMLYSALKEDNFKILEKSKVEFEPYGLTLVTILAESHAIIHTYPEYESLTFDLYSCRGPNDGRKTYNYFEERVNPLHAFLNIAEVPVDPNYIVNGNTLNKTRKANIINFFPQ
ncbi:MAG: S-adenosylmethionine decarboxylase [Nanoarchaeota archaeon]|nr:S-adenosylmethionine decarboxylase [Nanoarchaeota archaeon]